MKIEHIFFFAVIVLLFYKFNKERKYKKLTPIYDVATYTQKKFEVETKKTLSSSIPDSELQTMSSDYQRKLLNAVKNTKEYYQKNGNNYIDLGITKIDYEKYIPTESQKLHITNSQMAIDSNNEDRLLEKIK